MKNTEAQKKAIDEAYSKEGSINKKKEPKYDEESEGDHKGKGGYRTKENAKEKAGKLDKEGKASHKCTSCGEMH